MGAKSSKKDVSPGKHSHSIFRSEEMLLCQFCLSDDVAYACIAVLGDMGLVEFHDLNDDLSAKDRPYFGEMSLLNHAQSTLDLMRAEIVRNKIKIQEEDLVVVTPDPGDLLEIEETFEKLREEIEAERNLIEDMKTNLQDAQEIKHVLSTAKTFLAEGPGYKTPWKTEQKDEPDIEEGRQKGGWEGAAGDMRTIKVNYIAGVIPRKKFPAFELLVWRVSRGMAVVKFEHIDETFEEPTTGKPVYKTGFLVFFQGEQLRDRIMKIANGFHAVTHTIPEDRRQYDRALSAVNKEIGDLKSVIETTENHYKQLLNVCARNIENWNIKVIKMKAIYNVLNNFKSKVHVGEGWLPAEDLNHIRDVLRDTAKEHGGVLVPVVTVVKDPHQEPPTFVKNSKFTYGFQALIDAYGIATYKELNPMPYTVVTFPYLFSMMFGDFGHGCLLVIFGGTMVAYEKQLTERKSRSEIRNIIVGGRYIILLMGIFSLYAGLIYNDCFALSFNVFGSAWTVNTNFELLQERGFYTLDPKYEFSGRPFPFGIDPIWEIAENKIIFLNSFKMKISIIFGVIQMMIGLFLNLWNNWYFHQTVNIFCELLPMVIWMVCMFVYLSFLMIFKWAKYGPKKEYTESPTCAPSVLIYFIGMILHHSHVVPRGCDLNLYPYENIVEEVLFVVAIVTIPWLLFLKPLCILVKQKKRKKSKGEEGMEVGERGEGRREEEEEDDESGKMSEIMIHQGIITIEYVLGTISHTASYLRLWALSLAHSQLTEVLWQMILGKTLTKAAAGHYFGGIFVSAAWMIWALLTLGILVLMEGLSAFLHTLRLHWVEFQSKFYSGLGYAFNPFSFDKIIDAERNG